MISTASSSRLRLDRHGFLTSTPSVVSMTGTEATPEGSVPMNAASVEGSQPAVEPSGTCGPYIRILNWVFTAFNSIRILTYLPNIWAIVQSGQSGQHSPITWLSWVGANASMAAWLYESNGRHWNKAIAVNLCNAVMCAATCLIICAYR